MGGDMPLSTSGCDEDLGARPLIISWCRTIEPDSGEKQENSKDRVCISMPIEITYVFKSHNLDHCRHVDGDFRHRQNLRLSRESIWRKT
mmetsp:Transcript_32212/g.78283  ORF Transcript_32212/g.78283 Transcript_32212/m.78283 type:complete len:89 (-) Transcript_32212:3079-3345(-)